MTFLLDHRPPNLHVVVSTRADPNLPLARLRARGELVEIRARDLRFTVDETASYLTDVGGLAVDADDVSALESRTEGWAAALQLAVAVDAGPGRRRRLHRRIRRRRPATSSTTSSTRCCPASPTRYATSWSGRRSSTCSAATCATRVLERTGSRAMLETLERANLFLVPLDDQRQLVPLPPPVRRRPAGAPAQRAARRRRRGCTCVRAAGTTAPESPCPPCATRWPQATSTGLPISSRRPLPPCSATGRRRRSAAGSTTSPTRSCRVVRSSPSGSSAR